MKSASSRFAIAGVAASLAFGSVLPLEAAPLFAAGGGSPFQSSNIVKVQAGGGDMGGVQSRGFSRRGGWAYYNGYRGYRERRRGYRRHNGYWFPLAAFAAGALIAGAAANSARAAPPVVVSNPHVDWCLSRYRSYNPYDNTFQPFNGPRRYCRSPFGG